MFCVLGFNLGNACERREDSNESEHSFPTVWDWDIANEVSLWKTGPRNTCDRRMARNHNQCIRFVNVYLGCQIPSSDLSFHSLSDQHVVGCCC